MGKDVSFAWEDLAMVHHLTGELGKMHVAILIEL
jgi:hypothetical protein